MPRLVRFGKLPELLLIGGVALLAAGLTGVDIELGDVKVPSPDDTWERVAASVLGALLLGLGLASRRLAPSERDLAGARVTLMRKSRAVLERWGEDEPTLPVYASVDGSASARLALDPKSLVELFERHGALLITGSAGSGKSTLAARIALGLIDARAHDSERPVPVLVRLATVKTDQDVHQLVVRALSEHGIGRAIAEEWVTHRNVLPILDGLDEARDVNSARKGIERFRKAGDFDPELMVCSRDTGEVPPLTVELRIQDYGQEQLRSALVAAGMTHNAATRTAAQLAGLPNMHNALGVQLALTTGGGAASTGELLSAYVGHLLKGADDAVADQERLRRVALNSRDGDVLPDALDFESLTHTRDWFRIGMAMQVAYGAAFAVLGSGLGYWIGGYLGAAVLGAIFAIAGYFHGGVAWVRVESRRTEWNPYTLVSGLETAFDALGFMIVLAPGVLPVGFVAGLVLSAVAEGNALVDAVQGAVLLWAGILGALVLAKRLDAAEDALRWRRSGTYNLTRRSPLRIALASVAVGVAAWLALGPLGLGGDAWVVTGLVLTCATAPATIAGRNAAARAVLARREGLPWRLRHFLERMTRAGAMRTVPGGWTFFHRLYYEHLNPRPRS
jgi:hypothetical protein